MRRRDTSTTPGGRAVQVAALLAALLAVLQTLQLGVARADTAGDLDTARKSLAQAQASANETAADMSKAEGRIEELGDQIATLHTDVEQARQREHALVTIVRQRATTAYTRASVSHLSVVLDASGPLQAARRAQFLDLANEKDNLVREKLAAVRSDLRAQQSDLRDQRDKVQAEKERLNAKSKEIQDELVTATKARDDLIRRLEREQAAAAQQAAARQAAAARDAAVRAAASPPAVAPAPAPSSAAGPQPAPTLPSAAELARLRAAQPIAPPPSGGGGAPAGGGGGGGAPAGGGGGQIIANPGGGAFQCPVSGAADTDSYGPRGSGFHYGIDMFAPMGAPLVAVKSGSVRFVPNEGDGGNTAYLSASDGNVYFYAHLSAFVGGARSVGQGEVIGLVGMTGNATAPHVHFEIRLGGANGQRIDPYATLRGAGC